MIITGAARGIGALTARKLHERGASVALLGLEPELLAQVAADCGDAPWVECDVADRERSTPPSRTASGGSAASTSRSPTPASARR